MILPMLTAREYPTIGSQGELPAMFRRLEVIIFASGVGSRRYHTHFYDRQVDIYGSNV
jgi:hypothetical protein